MNQLTNRRLFVLLYAAAAGYISLSQEMVWMRAVGYVSGGLPAVFAYVLGFFLVGVALAALYGQRLCDRSFTDADPEGPRRYIAIMLLVSAAFYYLSLAGVAELLVRSSVGGTAAIYAVVAIVSFLLGGIFTVLCHYGARAGEAAGVTVSKIYLANIIGSTLGPLLTGFVLMQHFTASQIVLQLSVATAALGLIALALDRRYRPLAPIIAGCFALMFALQRPLYRQFLERLSGGDAPYKYTLENRSGIIAIKPGVDGETPGSPNQFDHPDLIFGNGMYDGRFNIDPVQNGNWISRCYNIAALHPDPKDVLEIGLSSASWTRVMANYTPIQHLTTVEINGGYVTMLRQLKDIYPDEASVLDDPKVTIAIDDGRRWLKRHPAARFDMIVQNTTWHFRAEVTNLLSVEYLQLCKAHLNPGGVMYWNTTDSKDIPFTAAHVFKFVATSDTSGGATNFVIASDQPFTLTTKQIQANLMKFVSHGRAVFGSAPPWMSQERQWDYVDKLAALERGISQNPPRNERDEWLSRTDLRVITDDNMLTEYKRAWRKPEGGDIVQLQSSLKVFSGTSWSAFFSARRK